MASELRRTLLTWKCVGVVDVSYVIVRQSTFEYFPLVAVGVVAVGVELAYGYITDAVECVDNCCIVCGD